MKRLKLYCPFHGKYWPLIAAAIAALAAWSHASSHDWPETGVRAVLFLAPLAVLAVCYFIIQRPSAAERELIADADYPLWVPADENILRAVIEQKQHFSSGMTHVLLYLGVFAFAAVLPGRRGGEPNFTAAAVFALIAGAVAIVDTLLRSRWQSADQSALMAVVPIDHMFDVLHTSRGSNINPWIDRREWYTSYLVFYLPDGRYVLPAYSNAGYAKVVVIVKYNGMLTWIPCAENHPKGDMK